LSISLKRIKNWGNISF